MILLFEFHFVFVLELKLEFCKLLVLFLGDYFLLSKFFKFFFVFLNGFGVLILKEGTLQ
jgi:hypothetical protein